jgi:hypothetical protein
MTLSLPAVAEELVRWSDAGLVLPLWWRDDDAVEPTRALDRLCLLAERYHAPLHLAVIPHSATAELAGRVDAAFDTHVVVHGWRHRNNAPPGQKKAEFGPHRPREVMVGEIAAGHRRLRNMFGAAALPVFTPPWNRIAPELVDALAPVGLRALSTYTPRRTRFAAEGLLQVNTHLDPVSWKSGGGLLDVGLLDVQLAAHLADRRLGIADDAEPYGILTHHLVHDEAIWAFLEGLMEMLGRSGVCVWTRPFDQLDAPNPQGERANS